MGIAGFAIPKPHGCEVKPKCPFLEFGFLGLKTQLRIQLGFLTVNTVSAIVRMHKDILVVTFYRLLHYVHHYLVMVLKCVREVASGLEQQGDVEGCHMSPGYNTQLDV